MYCLRTSWRQDCTDVSISPREPFTPCPSSAGDVWVAPHPHHLAHLLANAYRVDTLLKR